MPYTIKVIEDKKTRIIKAKENTSLLKVLLKNGFDINAYCGGEGICGKCKVKLKGEIRKPNKKEYDSLDKEELEAGYRLSCLYKINSDLEVILEEKDDITVMTGGILTELDVDHNLSKKNIKIDKATIENQKDYLSRIYKKTNTNQINYKSLAKIHKLDISKKLTVLKYKDQILNLDQDSNEDKFYGLAVDIGTTTVVIYLMDLNTGEELKVNSFYNPQKKFGADVISRINYSYNNENGIKELKDVIINKLNEGIKVITEDYNITADDIYKMSIVGNTIMMHLLLGIDAISIAKSPYVPIFTDPLTLKPKELGLKINNKGLIQLLPSISGYVGADITGDMLTINMDKLKGNNLMIDIGTNGEIVLSSKEKIYCCSAAAGPAFEGANITFGTAGISGAISSFKIKDKNFEFSTINDQKVIGICGSGLLDMIAEFYKHDFIDSSGKINDKEDLEKWQKKYLSEYKGQTAIKITNKIKAEKEIYLTQKDIREVQLAKAAIAAGIKILLKKLNLQSDQIDRVFIAGGFGNYINPDNACFIKLIPQNLKDKIIQIGNGAGTGAKIYLLNKKAKKRTIELKDRVKYIELSTNQRFQTEYINSMNF